MLSRPDLAADANLGVDLVQITTDPCTPTAHVYMEAPVFTPDSRRVVLNRSVAGPNPVGRKDDPRHRFELWDLVDGGAPIPLTDELGATAPAVSPDGRFFYHI